MIANLIPRVNAVSESQKEFYISYCWKTADYGTDTTAMVIHETSQFLILSGDHRENYKGLDFKQSLAYFYANVDKAVPQSEHGEVFTFRDGKGEYIKGGY